MEKAMEVSNQHYLNHLAEINCDNKVILSEDIYNSNGVLVVKKGVEVDRELAFKVAKHKLSKPLDLSISLTHALGVNQILELYQRALQRLGLYEFIHNSGSFDEVEKAFKALAQYPMIMQKLSVFENRLPSVFARSMTSAGLVIGLCKELGLSPQATENAFIANILCDVGLLHIDPDIVNKQGAYSPEEWRMMQGHVAIAKHFADQVASLPPQVGRALLEHHERADGLGYPFAKRHGQLCVEGQVVAIVDKICALAQKLVQEGNYCWQSVIFVMHVPSTAFFEEVQNAALRLLKKLSLPFIPAYRHAQYRSMLDKCIERRASLQHWFADFMLLVSEHKADLAISEPFNPLELV